MSRHQRHDFGESTKRVLAQRVGYRCSNPECGTLTSGPHTHSDKATIIGVASHITAAAMGGPRYDSSLSFAERRSPENGVWLCQNCAKLIDSDEDRYPVNLLLEWKVQAEAAARMEITGQRSSSLRSCPVVDAFTSVDNATLSPDLSDELSFLVEQDIENARKDWRRGRKERAAQRVEEIISKRETWNALKRETQAKILCFQGNLELDSGNLDQAKECANGASELASTANEARLRALIAVKENDLAGAIAILSQLDDIDTMNLHAAILFDAGRRVEGFDLLLNSNKVMNAESHRLLSLGYLLTGELINAQIEIQKALDLEPSWRTVKYATAMIKYYSALSTTVLPQRLPAWPAPVDWMLIKRDEESRERLARAASIFAELADGVDSDRVEEARLRIWCMASLANLSDQQDKAINVCRQIIEKDPTDFPAILWIIARNWDIDLTNSMAALQGRIDDKSAAVPDVLALARCYLSLGRASRIPDLLEDTLPLFEAADELPAWQMTYAQALMAQGEFDAAKEYVDTIDETRRLGAEIQLLSAQAERDGQWQTLIRLFWSHFEETDDPQSLLGYCEIQAQQGNWDEVAKHAFQLVAVIGTGEALRLGAIAMHNSGMAHECLTLIDSHASWFGTARLPFDIRQIRIACHRSVGAIVRAVSEAEHLAAEEPSITNLANLAGLYAELGDSKRLTVLARRLVGKERVPAGSLISIASIIRGDDINLSRKLWQQAVSQDISDELVGPAFILAFELGIEHEEQVQHLHERVSELGRENRAGVYAVESSQFMDILHERRSHLEFLGGLYQDGTAPLHIIAEQIGWPLVYPYHSWLTKKEQAPDPLHQPILWARHGGRIDTESFTRLAAPPQLNLDITTLLLAEHLGILEIAERAFAPLRIPSSVMAALLYMEDRVQQYQPDRIRAAQEVLRYIQDRRITVVVEGSGSTTVDHDLERELGADWTALFTMAVSHCGFFCTFLPPRKNDLSGEIAILPEEARRRLVNAGSVVQTLIDSGVISKTAFDNAMTILGSESRTLIGYGVPQLGTNLYCLGSVAQLLASAKVLPAICRHFNVILLATDVNLLHLEVDSFVDAQETVRWLRDLRDHLRHGIEIGSYVIIPENPRATDIKIDDGIPGPYATSLMTLLNFGPQANDLIWADDRYCNSFARRVGVPIIGINEILGALRLNGKMSEEEYFGSLHRLRAANVRLIPLSPDEILFHLKQARVENGCVVETLPLKVLRKYFAACLLQGNLLQRPPLPEGAANPAGEVFYITHLHRVVTQALVEVWIEDGVSPEVLHARSNWIWGALVLDLANMRRMVFLDGHQNDQHLLAMSYTNLLTSGLQLPATGKAIDNRRLFYDWLYKRALRIKLMVEPSLAQIVAGQVKDALLGVYQNLLDRMTSDDRRLAVQAVLQRYFFDLPEEIQLALRNDAEVVARLGIDFEIVMELGGLMLAKSTFAKAAGQVINGDRATVRALSEPSVWVTFVPLGEDARRYGFSYVDPINGVERVVLDDRLALLSDSISQRERVLEEHSYWIDASQDDVRRIRAEIVSIIDPVERLDKLDEHMASSAAVYYRQLEANLDSRSELAVNGFLPPSAAGLLRHFRLDQGPKSSSAFRVEIDKSTEDLLQTTDIVDAIIRLMSLPVPLPDRLIEAIRSLPENQKRSMCRRLLRKIGSPLARIHAVRLFLRLSDQIPALSRLANCIAIDAFSNAASEEFDGFSNVLRWVYDCFASWTQMDSWPSSLRLAMSWSHANRVFCAFRSAGAGSSWLRDFFGQLLAQERLRTQLLTRESDDMVDVVHPHRLTYFRLLVQGLAYAFANHELSAELRLKFEQEFIARGIPDMLCDPVLHQNCLDSFLGLDFRESTAVLFGDEGISQISHETLESILSVLVQTQLSQGNRFQQREAWIRLSMLLGDLEPPHALQLPLHAAMAGTDFAESFVDDPLLGSAALQAAAQQLRWQSDDGLRLRFQTHLLTSATILGENSASVYTSSFLGWEETKDTLISRLLETALVISLASPPETDVATDFSQLLEHLFRVLPEGLPVGATVVQRFFEDLPIDQSKEFARLYLQLRAALESFE